MRAQALALVLLGAAGCAPPEGGRAGSADGGPVSAEALDDALETCLDGDPEVALARLDSAVARAPASVDALTTRGLCRWTRFAADSAAADAEAAYADFTAALDAADHDGDAVTPVDRVYSHRAFVARALGDGWDATIADLTAAIEAAPDRPLHLLDRAVAYRAAGDTAAARADLRRFLALADSADEVRRDMVAEMLADLGDDSTGP